eukprot:376421_1
MSAKCRHNSTHSRHKSHHTSTCRSQSSHAPNSTHSRHNSTHSRHKQSRSRSRSRSRSHAPNSTHSRHNSTHSRHNSTHTNHHHQAHCHDHGTHQSYHGHLRHKQSRSRSRSRSPSQSKSRSRSPSHSKSRSRSTSQSKSRSRSPSQSRSRSRSRSTRQRHHYRSASPSPSHYHAHYIKRHHHTQHRYHQHVVTPPEHHIRHDDPKLSTTDLVNTLADVLMKRQQKSEHETKSNASATLTIPEVKQYAPHLTSTVHDIIVNDNTGGSDELEDLGITNYNLRPLRASNSNKPSTKHKKLTKRTHHNPDELASYTKKSTQKARKHLKQVLNELAHGAHYVKENWKKECIKECHEEWINMWITICNFLSKETNHLWYLIGTRKGMAWSVKWKPTQKRKHMDMNDSEEEQAILDAIPPPKKQRIGLRRVVGHILPLNPMDTTTQKKDASKTEQPNNDVASEIEQPPSNNKPPPRSTEQTNNDMVSESDQESEQESEQPSNSKPPQTNNDVPPESEAPKSGGPTENKQPSNGTASPTESTQHDALPTESIPKPPPDESTNTKQDVPIIVAKPSIPTATQQATNTSNDEDDDNTVMVGMPTNGEPSDTTHSKHFLLAHHIPKHKECNSSEIEEIPRKQKKLR